MKQVEREIELRRHRKTLTVLGAGVIAFGFWSLMKTIMTILEDPSVIISSADLETSVITFTMLIGSVFLITGADLLLRILVGVTAIRTGRRTVKKTLRLWGFIVLVILNVLASLVDAGILALGILFNDGDLEMLLRIPDLAVSLLGDLTGLLITIQLLYAAVKFRRLMKEQYAD